MKVRSIIFCSIAIACPFFLSSCSAGNHAVFAPAFIDVTITPRPIFVPEGGTVVLTGSVSNNLGVPKWSILAAASTTNAGTLTPVSGSPNAIMYTAPPTPPIYDSSAPTGFLQGAVTVLATTTVPAQTTVPVVGDSVSFAITAPSVSVGLSPDFSTIALGTTEQFAGYAIGNVNYALTWQVNGVTGGAVPVPLSNPVTYTYPYGSISGTGLYTAPASLPAGSGNTVTITMISQADATKTASASVTLQ